ncbi:carboxypeptidase regulatory-like domain-containing protein [Halosimplex sp. TS25]|uniref:carboxypeptidase regulatory-like domain-containing protein n=1 Tax=Halosimplex rarum TaxID=3396619 RepID=UPI0039E9D9F4
MRSTRSLHGDERAIEGLPIRLVIALVVGVASLAVMMQILGGIGPVGQQEVTFEHSGDKVQEGSSGLTLSDGVVTTKQGDPVEDAQVYIEGDSLTLEDPVILGTSDEDGEISASSPSSAISPQWRPDQQKGTVKITIEPPSSGNFKDDEPNGQIMVTR